MYARSGEVIEPSGREGSFSKDNWGDYIIKGTGGVVRGTRPRPASTADLAPCRRLPAPVILSTPINSLYIPPHRRLEGL
jgi:hypothetical protein